MYFIEKLLIAFDKMGKEKARKKMWEENSSVDYLTLIECFSMMKRDKDTLMPDFENSIRYLRYESVYNVSICLMFVRIIGVKFVVFSFFLPIEVNTRTTSFVWVMC